MYMSYIKKQVDKKVVGLRVKTNMFINLPIKKKNMYEMVFIYFVEIYQKFYNLIGNS